MPFKRLIADLPFERKHELGAISVVKGHSGLGLGEASEVDATALPDRETGELDCLSISSFRVMSTQGSRLSGYELLFLSPRFRPKKGLKGNSDHERGKVQMARNVGPEDRVVRIVVALGLGLLIYMGVVGGTIASAVVGVFAAYLLVSGLLARCLFYKLADIDTSIQEQPYSTTDDRAGF
jgi:hypothetical protein